MTRARHPDRTVAPPGGAPPSPAPGFTLVETLVAMTVLAIALVVIFEQFSGALDAAHRSDAYTRAVWHAEEKMEEVLLRDALAEGEHEGDFGDGYRWRYLVEPEPMENGPASDDVAAFRVTVWVRWEQGRTQKELDVAALTLARPAGM